MKWTRADEKDRTNRRDHGLSFGTAKLVFDDPFALSRVDSHPDGDRWQTIGLVGPVVVFVVPTWPESDIVTGGDVGRIISARKATAHERKAMKKATSEPLLAEQVAELRALCELPDREIDTLAHPEQRDWANAQRGMFYRPVKQQLTLRLDADIVAWFKTHGPEERGYQTRINRALRQYVDQHERR